MKTAPLGTCPQYSQNPISDLLAECTARGIDLQPQGGGLAIDGPEAELTADLLTRLQTHKADLLTILQAPATPAPCDDPLFPPDLLAAMATATARWVNADDRRPEPIDAEPDAGPRWDDLQDAAEIPSCPTCPRLMTWQDATGRWRCPSCDPPERSRRLAERADRLRHLAAVRATVRQPTTDAGGSFPAITDPGPNGNTRLCGQTCLRADGSFQRLQAAGPLREQSHIATDFSHATDPRILADAVALCPRCGAARTLPELRAMTGGICWSCHLATATAIPRRRPDLRDARRNAAERFQRIAADILAEAGVAVVEYHERGLCGTAWAKEKRVRIPRPTTRRRLYIAAHEAGHVAQGHDGKAPAHREEYEAERYAHDALRRHGVPVPRKQTIAARRYVARKIHQAIRRGAKRIDPEALAWCKDCWTRDTAAWVGRDNTVKDSAT